ncbi:MAG: 16S rRNA (adenine(1518)-N(6)/adenine(1519)-N(6))-dimethyltransferase RsmA [Candidatus Aceula meridiana]|nr:16S rRNA (adenine(1518)-N(6)/adenine(1519)-N(6))-dimethyltransferase RsmA [Candidatus Aceula meridiana]
MKKLSSAIKPKKRFGQNFLINPHIVNKIILACDLKSSDSIVEIGPGKGALTGHIAPKVKNLFAIEKDKVLAKELSGNLENKNITFYNADFLKFNLESLGKRLKVVGNIPYYISSPIIEKIINNRNFIDSAFIMVQLEFGKRLVASPHSKDYGSLSCFIQYYYKPSLLFKIKNTSFYPHPKVQSCFMRLDPVEDSSLKAKDEKLLFQIIRQAFQQRRKTLRNSLAALLKIRNSQDVFEKLNIDPRLRAENLFLKDFIRIAGHVHSNC